MLFARASSREQSPFSLGSGTWWKEAADLSNTALFSCHWHHKCAAQAYFKLHLNERNHWKNYHWLHTYIKAPPSVQSPAVRSGWEENWMKSRANEFSGNTTGLWFSFNPPLILNMEGKMSAVPTTPPLKEIISQIKLSKVQGKNSRTRVIFFTLPLLQLVLIYCMQFYILKKKEKKRSKTSHLWRGKYIYIYVSPSQNFLLILVVYKINSFLKQLFWAYF